jgi:Major intrinsic protein
MMVGLVVCWKRREDFSNARRFAKRLGSLFVRDGWHSAISVGGPFAGDFDLRHGQSGCGMGAGRKAAANLDWVPVRMCGRPHQHIAFGKRKRAHMNPAVASGFWMMGKMVPPIAAGYIVAQLIGAVLGCLPLLVWAAMGHSISFGATTPGPGYTVWIALLGEILTTFCLASTLYIFIACRKLRRFTLAVIPFLYAIMAPLEAPLSGTSTNSARTFGPAGDFGTMGGLVDLLGWASRRCARRSSFSAFSQKKSKKPSCITSSVTSGSYFERI